VSELFIDTGPFIARHLGDDQHHAEARAGFAALEQKPSRLFTSNFVLDEAITLLSRRAGAPFAAARARAWYGSAALEILRPAADDERLAIELLEKYGDQRASYTDCVSFVLMRKRRIRRAFSFDADFAAAGFELLVPRQTRRARRGTGSR
jgi:uncharacterized protein